MLRFSWEDLRWEFINLINRTTMPVDLDTVKWLIDRGAIVQLI